MLLLAAGLYAAELNFCKFILNFCKFIVEDRGVTEAGVQRHWICIR
jgi:hypothetical protein